MTSTRVAMPDVGRCSGGTAYIPPNWSSGARLQRGDAAQDAQAPNRPRNLLADDVTRLTRENARLHAQLATAEVIIEI